VKATTLIGLGWQSTKKYLLAAFAVFTMRVGLVRILSAGAYCLAPLVVKFINFIIRRGFPDHLLVNEYPESPWWYQASVISEGLFVLVIGMLLGLWANVRATSKGPQ